MLYFILGGLLVVGVGVAIYEWRQKRTLLRHDPPMQGNQTEADREGIRAADVARHRAMGFHTPHQ